MKAFRLLHFLSGAVAVSALSYAATTAKGPEFIAGLEQAALEARNNAGAQSISVNFRTSEGWLTRHPFLQGGTGLSVDTRTAAARAIADVPGVGGVRWLDRFGEDAVPGEPASLHCQDDVEAILEARTIRFAEASAEVDPASEQVLDEVAAALEPCVGSIIAITGHTDSNGDEGANVALSQARANAVRWALIGRGIPADGLRAEGVGSSVPVEGLDPQDPANRRIEFSVIEKMPLKPTPIDTPGPG